MRKQNASMLSSFIKNQINVRAPIDQSATKQMVNAVACTIELWYTREVAKHERSVRVARGDSRVRL